MAGMSPILAGIIGGTGLGMTNIANDLAEQRKLAQQQVFEREKLEQERNLRQQAIDAQASQFQATQEANRAVANPDIQPLIDAGILPSGMGPTMARPVMEEYMKFRAAEDKRLAEQQQINVARSAILNQAARPDVAMPAEGAMYSEAETLPGKVATPRNEMLAAILGEPGAAAILEQMYPKPTYGNAPPGTALTKNGALTGETVPALPKDNRLSVKTEVRADGTYAITTDTLTGETTAAKIPGVPGQPQFAPQQPQQPTAAQSFTTAMQNYQAARDAYGEEDPRTKNLGAIAAGLRRVDPESGTPITAPKAVDPLKQAVADIIANRPPPGPGITPPRGAPRSTPTAPTAVPPPPFQGAIRIIGQDGRRGWLRPGEAMPAGAQRVP